MEVLNISKVVVIKTISKKKKCKKTKWLSDKDLQIVEKIREMKGIGEKERYSHLPRNFPQFAVIHKMALV